MIASSPAVSVSPSRRRRAGRASACQRPSASRLEQQHLDRAAALPPGVHPHRQHARVVQRPPGRRGAARRADRRTAGAGSRRTRGRTPAAGRCRAARPASARSARLEGRSRVRRCAPDLEAVAGGPGDDVQAGRAGCGTAPVTPETKSSAGLLQVPAAMALDRLDVDVAVAPRAVRAEVDAGGAGAVGVLHHRALHREPEARSRRRAPGARSRSGAGTRPTPGRRVPSMRARWPRRRWRATPPGRARRRPPAGSTDVHAHRPHGVAACAPISSIQNRRGSRAGAGSPRCAYPAGVTTRPRGVRWSRPSWSRYGS